MKKIIAWLSILLVSSCLCAQEPRLVEQAQDFVSLLAGKKYRQAIGMFDNAMKQAFPPDKLGQLWEKLEYLGGSFEKIDKTRYSKYQQYDLVYVTCKFKSLSYELKVVFNESGDICGLFVKQCELNYRTPDYVNSGAFRESAIEIGDRWKLPGTLSLPNGNGPFPAVVLVHGSGSHDRDETIGPNKPLRDLAWGLASRGIAVIRYDKRNYVYPEKLSAIKNELTMREIVVEDALLAAEKLHTFDEIDPKRVFVLGHSLGAMMAPRIGALNSSLAGLILMAAPSRPLEDLIVEQSNYIYMLDGVLSDEEKRQLQKIKEQVARVKDPALSKQTPANELPFSIPPSIWMDWRAYHQVETAKKLKMPLLVLQGDRDFQVTTVDFKGWQKAFAGRSNVRLKLYPGLNHLMINGKGPSSPHEYMQEGHIAPAIIADIAKWIKIDAPISNFSFQLQELEENFSENFQNLNPGMQDWFSAKRSYHSEYSLEAANLRVQNYRLAKKLIARVKEKGWVLVTAESVTGGNLAATLARAPGSGNCFAGGSVCYKIEAKRQLLGVPDTREDDLYDLQTARDMATGTARLYLVSEKNKVSKAESYSQKKIMAIATTGRAVTYPGHWQGGVYVALVIPGKKIRAAYFPHEFTGVLGTKEQARTKDEGMQTAVNKALEYALSNMD